MQKVVFEQTEVTPSKVVCVGRNYAGHIAELKNEIPSSMVIFNKPNSAITDKLVYMGEHCHYEAEISFLIKNSQISGVGFGLDLTKRDIQSALKEQKLPWERAKSFNHSAVFSHFVKIGQEDIENISLKLFVNGKLSQHATIDLMIYKPNEILTEVLSFMSLEDGDIIMTGTPKGVGGYKPGDKFSGVIYLDEKPLISKEWIVD